MSAIARRSKRPCSKSGCPELTTDRFCEKHKEEDTQYERQRGSAASRGYTYRWAKYSKRFLKRPENVICKLQLDDGCTMLADCVDHIQPPSGAEDPLFWDKNNHQSSCIHCNSVKGRKTIKGSGGIRL